MMAGLIGIGLELEPWRVVNDGVMGGVSSGEIVAADGGLRFQGVLSLRNRGGFASVRRQVDRELAATTRVSLRVRGDGRRYQFRVRQDSRFDGVSWRAEFDTDGSWQCIDLPLESFDPVFRGRKVPDAGPVVATRIRQIGFLIADGRAGPFALEITGIAFGGGDRDSGESCGYDGRRRL